MKYATSNEGGTDEASGWGDMQSSSDEWIIILGMIFETCDRSVYLCAHV